MSGEFPALCGAAVRAGGERRALNSLVDRLAALDYRRGLFVSLHDAKTLITALCLNVEPSDSFLAAKVTHLLNNILTKQNLQLDEDCVHKLIAWDLACLAQCSEIVLLDILHNLQTALCHKPQAGIKFTDNLLGKDGTILKLIEDPGKYSKSLNAQDTKLEAILLAMKCLLSLTVQPEDSKGNENGDKVTPEILENISNVLTKFLFKQNKGDDEFKYCKVVVYALRILSQVYLQYHNDLTIPLPELVGLSKHFILYGLVSATMPQKLAPSQQTIAQPLTQNAKGGKKQKVRKQRNSAVEGLKKEIPISDRSLTHPTNNFEHKGYNSVSQSEVELSRGSSAWPLTSDSDMSDAESGRDAKLVALKTRVRQSASNLLLVLIKVSEKKDMFGYWWALLPDSPNPDTWAEEERTKRTLAYCAVNDPTVVGRAGALNVVLALLSGSRLYLSQAEECKRAISSFTPFSVTLGHTITCLHKVLCSILETERNKPVLVAALKCCAALMQATPYHRLQSGLIGDVVRVSRGYLMHRDITIQVAALIVTGCVLSIDPAVEEVLKSVQKDLPSSPNSSARPNQHNMIIQGEPECDDFEEGYSDDEEIFVATPPSGDQKPEIFFRSWILDVCIKNLGWTRRGDKFVTYKQAALPIVLESLQVISAIAFHHFRILLEPHMRLLADIFADMLADSHSEVVLQTAKTVSSVADAMLKLDQKDGTVSPLKDPTYFWEKLLSGPLSTVLQSSENQPAKTVACDCVANIGDRVFKELPRHLQMLCCALLSGACGDEEATVRAAAVRALAMCVVYPSLREDLNFVSNCVENVLRALKEPALAVRVKAAWALGNLTDALLLNMKDPEMNDADDFVKPLLAASIQCASENDKIKLNAPRAIGNLLRLVQMNSPCPPELKMLIETAIGKLLECTKSSNMKIRWNACYAIGNALKNPYLYEQLSEWQGPVFASLCALALDCKNLKVRINAAVALRSPQERAQYGRHLQSVWRGVMAAMENAANVDDFTEYRHKDNLVEQLCVTLSHMCCRLTAADLTDISDPLSFHFECAKKLFTHLSQKLLPETESCTQILEAAKYATVNLTAETDSQKQTLALLQDIFIWVT